MIRNKRVADSPSFLPQKAPPKKALAKSQVNRLQEQYLQAQHQIMMLLNSQTKPIQIRLKEWLRKFESVVEVQPWLRNRNLHCRVMRAMLRKNTLAAPFNKLPPSTSLPMLSVYEIPFDIREQIEKGKEPYEASTINDYECQKQNRNETNASMGMDGGLSYHRSKQRYSTKDKILHKKSLQGLQKDDTANIESEICSNVRSSYDFLLKNRDKFMNEQQVNDLLEELWNFTACP